MKLANIAYLLIITVALSLSSTGCKKKPDRTTQIPGRGLNPPTENAANMKGIGEGSPLPSGNTIGGNTTGGNPVPAGTTGEGIEAPKGDFSNWTPNRDTFKEQTVYFDFDKSIVKATEVAKLEEVARRMKSEFAGKALKIEGHCDERGTEEYNRSLGDKRALSIRESLAKLGVDPAMMPTISMGEEQPADPGHTETAFAKNRRGELILLSPPGAN